MRLLLLFVSHPQYLKSRNLRYLEKLLSNSKSACTLAWRSLLISWQFHFAVHYIRQLFLELPIINSGVTPLFAEVRTMSTFC